MNHSKGKKSITHYKYNLKKMTWSSTTSTESTSRICTTSSSAIIVFRWFDIGVAIEGEGRWKIIASDYLRPVPFLCIST
ncbi:hypothetical protein TSUD_175650 [Trifolium subterraneum]|uniref:Uncharacterized protein n=1 Tax=Trifolium subterraneum TaxID=3900 RepID=A0A2Z6LL57_TRISU|nr:hypothetical protein TSUD_175650 [Trifolium subterraneum]